MEDPYLMHVWCGLCSRPSGTLYGVSYLTPTWTNIENRTVVTLAGALESLNK